MGRFADAFEALECTLAGVDASNDEARSANVRLSRAHFFLELGLLERAGAEVESGLLSARRLPTEVSSVSADYLTQERLELAAVRIAMRRDASGAIEAEIRRLIGTFERSPEACRLPGVSSIR